MCARVVVVAAGRRCRPARGVEMNDQRILEPPHFVCSPRPVTLVPCRGPRRVVTGLKKVGIGVHEGGGARVVTGCGEVVTGWPGSWGEAPSPDLKLEDVGGGALNWRAVGASSNLGSGNHTERGPRSELRSGCFDAPHPIP